MSQTACQRIDRDEVFRIARLARLQLTGDEATRLAAELDRILAYVARLDELDLSEVQPLAADAPAGYPREDTIQPSLAREQALGAAPESGQGHFKVPRVLK